MILLGSPPATITHNEWLGIDFRATLPSEISLPEIITVTRLHINACEVKGEEGTNRQRYTRARTHTCDGNEVSFYLRNAEERGATSLLMSNKNIEIHHPGAVGHLSSRGRKDPTDPIYRHQSKMIINGFTILEMSRVQSSRIYRGVKTKTRLPPPMVGHIVIRRYPTFSLRFSCSLFLSRGLSIRSAS